MITIDDNTFIDQSESTNNIETSKTCFDSEELDFKDLNDEINRCIWAKDSLLYSHTQLCLEENSEENEDKHLFSSNNNIWRINMNQHENTNFQREFNSLKNNSPVMDKLEDSRNVTRQLSNSNSVSSSTNSSKNNDSLFNKENNRNFQGKTEDHILNLNSANNFIEVRRVNAPNKYSNTNTQRKNDITSKANENISNEKSQEGIEINDLEFQINVFKIIDGYDRRTSVMIKNIPNKYSPSMILEEIEELFAGKFDIFYLPMDFKKKNNLGFAFINFSSSYHLIYFYKVFNKRLWNNFNSDKQCEIRYAKYQGKQELLDNIIIKKASDLKKTPLLFYPNCKLYPEIPLDYLAYFRTLYKNAEINLKAETFIVKSLYKK